MSFIKRPKPSWKLDSQALIKAYKVLNLRHPVTYRLVDMFWNGGYDQPLHTVEINHTLSYKEVSATIWHELGHAMQCERDGNGNYHYYWATVEPTYGTLFFRRPPYEAPEYDEWYDEYMQVPCEAEAEEIAMRYHKRYKLIR